MQVVDLFATPLTTSHYVELVNPLWTTHRLQARVVDVHDETPTTRTLTLKPGRGWHRHRAGQYVRVGVTVGGMRQTRTFSISSSPDRADGLITRRCGCSRRNSKHQLRNRLFKRMNFCLACRQVAIGIPGRVDLQE